MLNLINIFAVFLFVLEIYCNQQIRTNNDLIITLNHSGKIRGEEKSKYFSFKGIPYALPPVGDLRLRNPQPHPGWTTTLDASKHGASCEVSEDCLFLNVYTPKNLDPAKKYHVMFWIHGGAFIIGSGDSQIYGPEFFIKEGVIIVTINYRLGFLGFFSTNDRFAQGNYGLKDCVEALKWVQNNIEAFGGDRNQVTIFGESAGGALVHYLVLSPMATGLFHAAISQSGSAISGWALQDNPRTQALEAARLLNIEFTSSENFVQQIRSIEDPSVFANVTRIMQYAKTPFGFIPLPFSPNIEPGDSDEPRFLSNAPLNILQSGSFSKVPFICGANNEEGLFAIVDRGGNPNYLEMINNNFSILLPYEWYIQPHSEAEKEILSNIRKVYLNGENEITDIMDFVRYSGDRQFVYPAQKTVELHSQSQKSPVFFYIFSFDGSLNIGKKITSMSEYEGATHADELGYLWKISLLPLVTEGAASTVRERMVKMWVDFSKYGTPTPETNDLVTVNWPKVQHKQEYMDIGEELQSRENPFSRRMEMWKEMDQKYSNAN